ncbi:MAG: hypothetical protein CVU65_09795 [Deltaproteobacteria bacterium HGW-Deltaproteobacteria-22]|jgi:hypothetical protein|nr:MAG: hypothetical protein CVU65_09795 [Deltaproteobacteria bacterium HGW-Deltaproteobacteria-22]
MRSAILPLLIFGLASTFSCGKKEVSIEKMVSARDINGLSAVITADSEKTDRRIAAAHALVQLDLANRVMENIEKLGPQNPEAAKELVSRLTTELAAQMTDDSPKSIMARDALVTVFPRMNPDSSKLAADSILKWMVGGMEKRADCGNYKLLKVLEAVGPAATDEVLAELGKKHAAWMLADFKNRGEDGTLVYKRANPDQAGVKATIHRDTYSRYWKHFRKNVLDGVVAAYSITAPSDRQVQDITIIVDYAQGDERKKAGAVILEQMKSTQKATPMSVRALGELGAVGATEYLRTFVKPNIPKELRDAAFDAVTVIRDDPAAAAVLYEIAKPMFEAFLRKDVPDEASLPLVMQALKGLMLSRKCELPAAEYKLLRDAFKMKMDGTLFELRKGLMPALHRLMLCTGKTQALRDLQAQLRFPMTQDELTLVSRIMDSLPEDELLPIIRKDLSSKKLEISALAILTLGTFGQKEDLTLLEGMKSSKTPIPEWNMTLGELATVNAALLQKKIQTPN